MKKADITNLVAEDESHNAADEQHKEQNTSGDGKLWKEEQNIGLSHRFLQIVFCFFIYFESNSLKYYIVRKRISLSSF